MDLCRYLWAQPMCCPGTEKWEVLPPRWFPTLPGSISEPYQGKGGQAGQTMLAPLRGDLSHCCPPSAPAALHTGHRPLPQNGSTAPVCQQNCWCTPQNCQAFKPRRGNVCCVCTVCVVVINPVPGLSHPSLPSPLPVTLPPTSPSYSAWWELPWIHFFLPGLLSHRVSQNRKECFSTP